MIFLIVLTLMSTSFASNVLNFEGIGSDDINFTLDKELVDDIVEKYDTAKRFRDIGLTIAVNEFADKLFTKIRSYALLHNLEPTNLSDVHHSFLTASITLTKGLLHGISTIGRYEDALITYNSSNNLMEAYFPIEFTNLNFTYDYYVSLLFIGPRGGFTGRINSLRIQYTFGFDFNTYQAKVININTGNTGHVSLSFSGSPVVGLVMNILSEFVSTILHPAIVAQIEGTISSIAKYIVSTVNDHINSILHNNSIIS